MHWAIGQDSCSNWGRPLDDMIPQDYRSQRIGDAVQTILRQAVGGPTETKGFGILQPHVLEVRFRVPVKVKAMQFVLMHKAQVHDAEDRWYKADGDFHRPPSDFHIRMPKAVGIPYWSIWEKVPVAQDQESVLLA